MLFVILKVKKLLERFTKKNWKNQIKQSLELKMYSREKTINYVLTGKATIILLTVGLTKIMSLYKMSYFPELHTHSKSKREVELEFV